MDIGLIFTGADMTMAELTAIGRRAEQSGVASLYLAEAWRSGWVPLTALAAATTRVRLGPYVLNAYGRSPLLAGMSAIDFNDFSKQRLVLGVGGGNRTINEQWQGIPHERVLTKMAEYVTLLQCMASTRLGETLDFEGRIHRMHWSPAVDPGDRPFPVYLAAVFPRMLKVAGRVADGIACGATLSVDYLRDVVRPQVIDAAVTAGRDPDVIAWTAVHFIAVDEDRARARRAAREALCHLYAPLPHPYYEYTMREQGFGAAADAALTHMPAGHLEAAVAAIPDECIDRLVIAGTPEDCRARLAAYEGVVDEIVLLNALPAGDDGVEESYASLMQLVESLRNQAT